MQPMNYTIQTGGTGDAFQQGMSQTAGLMATVADYRKSQQLADAQRIANEQALQKQQDFRATAEAPTYENVRKLMIQYPELSEQFKRSLDSLGDDRKQGLLSGAFSVSQALEKGNTDAALKLVDNAIEAAKNSGDAQIKFQLETTRDMIVANPNAALFALQGTLFGGMGGEKYAQARKALGEDQRASELQPALVEKGKADASEAQSKATIAAAKAKFAESDAALDLQKKGWDITKIQEDIKVNKLNSQIAAMNAQTSRMNANTSAQGNNLKLQENQIKLQELIDKRETAVREKVAEAENTRSSIDNLLNVTDKILKTPMGVVGSAAGPISSRIPTLSQKTADFEALIETAGNLITMSNMGSMKGVLSDSDLKVLRGSVQNLSLSQSPETLMSNVKEVQRITLKSRRALAQKYGIPDSVPDTPAATPSGANIDALLKKYGQ